MFPHFNVSNRIIKKSWLKSFSQSCPRASRPSHFLRWHPLHSNRLMLITLNPLILRPQLKRKVSRSHNDLNIECCSPKSGFHVIPMPILQLPIHIFRRDIKITNSLDAPLAHVSRQSLKRMVWHDDLNFPGLVCAPWIHFELEWLRQASVWNGHPLSANISCALSNTEMFDALLPGLLASLSGQARMFSCRADQTWQAPRCAFADRRSYHKQCRSSQGNIVTRRWQHLV